MIKHSTYFVDIDGTLVKYRSFQDIRNTAPEAITSVLDFIKTKYDEGSHIVITTARPEDLRTHTTRELSFLGVKYHQLVMGIGRGTRYVINDKDPQAPEVDRAVGINLKRNEGL